MRFTVVSQAMGHLSATHKAIQKSRRDSSVDKGEENFVGDSEIIALGGASNETKDRPLG